MKKFLLLLMFLIVPCVVLMTACEQTPPKNHVAKTQWTTSNVSHWHECEVDGCTETFDQGIHYFDSGVETETATCSTKGNKKYTCLICGYEKNQEISMLTTHTFTQEYLYDREYHWKQSTCQHEGLEQGRAKHTLNSDNVCECGYEFYTEGLVFEPTSEQASEYVVSDFESEINTNVVIPSTYKGKPVVSIKERALQDTKISEVKIGKNIRTIGAYAFFDSDVSIVEFQEDSNLFAIYKHAFAFSWLKSITLPQSLEVMEEGLFQFTGIKAINIPKNVRSIDGDFLFRRCYALTSITVDANNAKYKSDSNCIIERETNKLIAGSLESVIPNYVTEIGEGAICSFYEDKTITIPASVKKINDYAFYECNITAFVFEKNSKLEHIGYGAFAYITTVEKFTIPASVKYIGECAFLISPQPTQSAELNEIVFEDVTGWVITKDETEKSIDVSVPYDNATHLGYSSSSKKWYDYTLKKIN